MKGDLILEETCCGDFYRWRLKWTERDVANRRYIERVFLGMPFKEKKDAEFERGVFEHDVLRKFNFKIGVIGKQA